MTATQPPPAELPARRTRAGLRVWLVPGVLLALTPKCFLCIAAYIAAGSALRLGSPEFCGGTTAIHWTTWLFALGLALGTVGFFAHSRNRRA